MMPNTVSRPCSFITPILSVVVSRANAGKPSFRISRLVAALRVAYPVNVLSGLLGNGRSSRPANESSQRNHIGDWLSRLEVNAEPRSKPCAPHRPPYLYSRAMIVRSNVGIPALPLLRVQSALAVLEPGVLKHLERGKQKRQRTNTIFLGRAVPVLNNSCKRTQ